MPQGLDQVAHVKMADLHKLYDEADALKEEGKLEEAVAKLNALLEQDDAFALAHSALAVILGKLNRHEDAVRHQQRVCELEPKDAFSFTAMSVVYQRAYAGTGNMEYIQQAEDAMARARMIQDGMI